MTSSAFDDIISLSANFFFFVHLDKEKNSFFYLLPCLNLLSNQRILYSPKKHTLKKIGKQQKDLCELG